jgi:hypothetical protein
MTRWEACPRLCSVSDCSQGRTLLLNCLLDGEAYENPALVIYDYLTSPMCGVDPEDIPIDYYITAANACDEPVQGLC